MSKHLIISLAIMIGILAAAPAGANERAIPLYYDQLQYNLTAPSAFATVIGGYANPAVYGMLHGGEGRFSWTPRDDSFWSMQDWGAFLGGENIGLGAIETKSNSSLQEIKVLDWRLGFAGGNKNATLGMGFGWTTGDKDLAGRSTVFQIGTVERLGRYASIGIVGAFAFEKSYQTGIFDVAVRPLGDDRLTLFGDAEYAKGFGLGNMPWSVGAVLEPARGVQLIGRYFDDERYAISVAFGFGSTRITATPYFTESDNTHTSYEVRGGFEQPSFVMDLMTKDSGYLQLAPRNVTYRGFKYFDTKRDPLYGLLADLERARQDPQVNGVAINLHSTSVSRGKAWELREKLQEIRDAGKHVVIYVGGMNMTDLHLSSVADRIVVDPEAIILVTGYALARTYVADALAKLGIGFEEWRFFTHKSAMEGFSRTSMSDEDREQRLSLVADRYAVVRDEVAASLNMTPANFDAMIDDETLINPQRAVELGIAHEIGRWDDVKDVVRQLEGNSQRLIHRGDLVDNRVPSTLWGEDPEVAVVYALGVCAFDSGIRARELDKLLKHLGGSYNVKAIVLRVDSPGGSGQASDWVAQRMKKISERKPVIVSQGDVAASGGYWLSMYGDKVFALPTTVVGSIGVIGGWVWDDGLGEKLGHTTDMVKQGEHADIGYGLRLLLAGPMLPARNLTRDEFESVKQEFLSSYDGFVAKVADGRGMPKDRVAELAEGRVYSGLEAKELGLVDEIGGLDIAIRTARELAGIDEDERVKVREYPVLPPFNFSGLQPGFPFMSALGWLGVDENPEPQQEPSYDWTYVRTILEAKGQPLYMLPPEFYFD